MLPICSSLRAAAPVRRSFALSQRYASSLVLLEHKNGKLNDSSLSAVTAARKLGEVRHQLLHRLKVLTARLMGSSLVRRRTSMVFWRRSKSEYDLAILSGKWLTGIQDRGVVKDIHGSG
jgi:hypothetical protein